MKRRTGDDIAIPGDYQYRVLERGWPAQRFWHHTKLIEAERWLAPAHGDVILDVGCGSGVLAARLAEHAGTQVIAIDSNPAAIEFAQQRFQRPNLEFRLGLADDLDLPSESVNKIAFMEVIEHIYPEQSLQVLRGFRQLLHPAGRVVISTPNAHSLWPLIEWSLDKLGLVPHLDSDQHVASYNLSSLVALAAQANLHLLAYRTFNGLAPWLATVSWRLALKVHHLEQRRSQRLGSLLLATFQKV